MPKMYLVTFNRYDIDCDTPIKLVSDAKGNQIETNPDGELMVQESNLAKFEKFGGGFKRKTLITVISQHEIDSTNAIYINVEQIMESKRASR